MASKTVTTGIKTTNTTQDLSRWQRIVTWLAALEQAMDYDPQQQANAGIRRLNLEIERLDARLDAAENRSRRTA